MQCGPVREMTESSISTSATPPLAVTLPRSPTCLHREAQKLKSLVELKGLTWPAQHSAKLSHSSTPSHFTQRTHTHTHSHLPPQPWILTPSVQYMTKIQSEVEL